MVHHIELPNLGEEPSNCFITILSEANGTSPTRKNTTFRYHVRYVKKVSFLHSQRKLFRTKDTLKIIQCIQKLF